MAEKWKNLSNNTRAEYELLLAEERRINEI